MTFLKPGITSNIPLLCIQKRIKKVLEKYGLCRNLGLRLSYEKQKYFNCHTITNCKLYAKKKKI